MGGYPCCCDAGESYNCETVFACGQIPNVVTFSWTGSLQTRAKSWGTGPCGSYSNLVLVTNSGFTWAGGSVELTNTAGCTWRATVPITYSGTYDQPGINPGSGPGGSWLCCDDTTITFSGTKDIDIIFTPLLKSLIINDNTSDTETLSVSPNCGATVWSDNAATAGRLYTIEYDTGEPYSLTCGTGSMTFDGTPGYSGLQIGLNDSTPSNNVICTPDYADSCNNTGYGYLTGLGGEYRITQGVISW